MVYSQLAQIYDLLMEDVDYNRWANYLVEQIVKHNAPGNVVLDLGCGTGSISLLLAEKGLQLTGIDISTDMLTQADQKFRENNLNIPLYKQDMRKLILDNYVDVVISTFDTFNYILKFSDLEITFKKVNQVLNRKGLFIFDLNTVFKLAYTLGNNTFTYNTEELAYIWENHYDRVTRLCQMDLTFFSLEEKSGKYLRFDETHIQRAYEEEEISKLLSGTGFDLLGIYGELTFNSPKLEEEKIFFVAKKK